MLRLVVVSLLVAVVVDARIVRRQAAPELAGIPAPACPFEHLPVLNICPPCQPSACFCANGKELSLEDQKLAEQVCWKTSVLLTATLTETRTFAKNKLNWE